MSNIIPDTDSIEVARIAAAVYLAMDGTPASRLDLRLTRFAQAFEIIDAVTSGTPDSVKIKKLLDDLATDLHKS